MTAPAAKPAQPLVEISTYPCCRRFFLRCTLLFYTTTDSFQSQVRRRLVAEIERITGGRAQIGSFHTIPFRLQFEVRNITVHGRESATDVPLAHVDNVVARLKISSLLRSELAFQELVLDQPVIHLPFIPTAPQIFPGAQARFLLRRRSSNSSRFPSLAWNFATAASFGTIRPFLSI